VTWRTGRPSASARVRRAAVVDVPAIAALIEAAFASSIAPAYDLAGRVAFRMYASERAIRERLEQGALGLVACVGERVVGYAEIQGAGRVLAGRDHLSLLFTAVEWQRRGIGRRVLAATVRRLRRLPAPPRHLTVHAAPSAVAAYLRLGFRPTGPETERDGHRFVPMALRLGPPPADKTA
jgi:GNAT superfamily N-acetyltransferase